MGENILQPPSNVPPCSLALKPSSEAYDISVHASVSTKLAVKAQALSSGPPIYPPPPATLLPMSAKGILQMSKPLSKKRSGSLVLDTQAHKTRRTRAASQRVKDASQVSAELGSIAQIAKGRELMNQHKRETRFSLQKDL